MSAREWSRLHADFKNIREDGTKTAIALDRSGRGTCLFNVEIR